MFHGKILIFFNVEYTHTWQYHLPPNKEANWLFQHKHKLVDHKANWIRVHIRVLIAASLNDNLR